MKKTFLLIAAVLVIFGALVVAPASRAQAADKVDQNALAMALATLLGSPQTSSGEAFAALTALGIMPVGGWVDGGAVTLEIEKQINDSIAVAVEKGVVTSMTKEELALEGDIVAKALGSLGTTQKQRGISPHTP